MQKTELRSLTGLRGVAALDVAVQHINGADHTFLQWIGFQNQAVDIFFCLSSFTLCYVYEAGFSRSINWRNFFAARFARIYPLYFSVFVIALLCSMAWDENQFHLYGTAEAIRDGTAQLLMVNAWPLVGTGAHWDAPMWSLSIEVFCYIFIFPAVFLISLYARKLQVGELLLLIVICVFSAYFAYSLWGTSDVCTHRVPANKSVMAHLVITIRAVSMFVAGWLAYLASIRIDQPSSALADTIALAFLFVIAASALGIMNIEALVLLTPFLILGASRPSTSAAYQILAAQPMRYLGLISYSLYAWHWPINVIARHLLPLGPSITRTALVLCMSICVAAISYHTVETGARSWLRRKLSTSGATSTGIVSANRSGFNPT